MVKLIENQATSVFFFLTDADYPVQWHMLLTHFWNIPNFNIIHFSWNDVSIWDFVCIWRSEDIARELYKLWWLAMCMRTNGIHGKTSSDVASFETMIEKYYSHISKGLFVPFYSESSLSGESGIGVIIKQISFFTGNVQYAKWTKQSQRQTK